MGLSIDFPNVTKPCRGRLETFALSPTQSIKLMLIVVFVAPN
ncbi:hypothetical protein ABH904_000781 [Pseudomonas frederiksbergensis]